MIKNIILDIGNVVLEDSGEVLEKFLNISKEEVKRLRMIVYTDKRFTKCLLGEISQEEYKEELIKEYPDNKKEIEKLLEAKYQKEVLPIKQDTIDLMVQLKENYNLYFLSNLTQDSYYYIKELGITNLVKGGVYSFEAKEKKPQEVIYNILLERYQLNKEETIFFDDMPRNVEKGNELGIKSVIFKDTQDIIKALRQESE